MDFSLDGNRRMLTVPHDGLHVRLDSSGIALSLSPWSAEGLHVAAQMMAAAGDKGVPVVLSCSAEQTLAWALVYCGYGTGDPYDRCRDWVAERAGCPVDEDEPHWIMARGMLWP